CVADLIGVIREEPMDRRNFLALGGVAAVTGSGLVFFARGAAVGNMIPRRIPTSGEALPRIGLATSESFEVDTAEGVRAPLREVLQAFFENGATLIDTSPMYSSAEKVLGELLTADQQEKAFIATKVWTPGVGN